MSALNIQRRFKIIIVGDGGVGKSAFVKRLRTGEFEQKYLGTMGVEVSPLTIDPHAVSIWDCAGQERFRGLGKGYYQNADAAILMFDVTSRISYKNLPVWFQEFRETCPEAPVVLCGNKVDVRNRVVYPKDILFHRKHNLQYYDVSVKSCYNIDKPLAHLLKCLNPDAMEVETVAE